MKDFILAALPWVVMGLTLAIFLAFRAKRKTDGTEASADTETKKTEGDHSSEGISLGMCFGVAFGIMFDQLALGISLGMLLGLAIGMGIKKK